MSEHGFESWNGEEDISRLSADERNIEAPAPGAGGPGYVYIISNPSMPDLVKVGLTARPVEDRMYDLQSTGVPTPFVKEFALHVDNARAVEQLVHELLNDCRVSANREFFRCTNDRAQKMLFEAADGRITNADILPSFSQYHEEIREDLLARHRSAMDEIEKSKRFWKRSAVIAFGPAALFILTLVGVFVSA